MFIFAPTIWGDESILTNIMLSSLFHGLKPPPRYGPGFWCEQIKEFSHLGEWHSEQHKHENTIQIVV